LITIEKKKKLFLDYHNEYHKFQEFFSGLQDKGYDIECLKKRTDFSLISNKDFDVLVVVIPVKKYTDEEVEAIKQFVEEGGGLIILGDAGYWMRKVG